MPRNKLNITICMLLIASICWGQRHEKPKNYRRFDEKWLHFGFMLGINTTDFSTAYKPNLLKNYDLYSITNSKQPGFQLGLIGSVKLGTPLLHLRFMPTISFQERVLDYKFRVMEDGKYTIENREERVGSTNLDFPLLLKFRTLRYNNFAAYLIGGVQYTLDLQSKEKSPQQFSDPFIKIFRDDWQGQIGAGVDFFLPFFKFSIELKFSHGFSDVLIHDDTELSRPIRSLYNRVWLLSFTFEG